MRKSLSIVLLISLLISIGINIKLLSENQTFEETAKLCTTKQSATDWYHQHLAYENSRDTSSAELCLSIAAQLGHAEAQSKLGRIHLDRGDEKLAETWMTEAAKQGNAEHQYQLGRCYDYVYTWESDEEKAQFSRLAFSWYEKSATQNHAAAAKFLAQCYRVGRGCEKDLSAAEYWYKKAAELGEYVNRGLAEVYIETGRPELAMPLLSAEAAAGSSQARTILNNLNAGKADSH